MDYTTWTGKERFDEWTRLLDLPMDYDRPLTPEEDAQRLELEGLLFGAQSAPERDKPLYALMIEGEEFERMHFSDDEIEDAQECAHNATDGNAHWQLVPADNAVIHARLATLEADIEAAGAEVSGAMLEEQVELMNVLQRDGDELRPMLPPVTIRPLKHGAAGMYDEVKPLKLKTQDAK